MVYCETIHRKDFTREGIYQYTDFEIVFQRKI